MEDYAMLIRKFHILTVSLLILLCFCTTTMSADQISDDSLTPFERELNKMYEARQSRDEPRFDWRLLETQRHYELAVGAKEFSNSLSLLYFKAALLKFVRRFGENHKNIIPQYAKDDSEISSDTSYYEIVNVILPEITHNAVNDAKEDIIQCMLFVNSHYSERCLYGQFPQLHNIVKTCCVLGENELGEKISEYSEKRARSFTNADTVRAGLMQATKCQLNLGNTQKAVALIDETHGIMDNCSHGRPHREYQKLMFMFADAGEHDIALEMCSRLEDASDYSSHKLPLASIKHLASKKHFDLCIEFAALVRQNDKRTEAILAILDSLEQVSDTEKLPEYLQSLYQTARSTTSYYQRSRMLSKLAVAFHRIGNTKLAEEIIFNELRFSKPDIAETINIDALYFPISALVDIGHKQSAVEVVDRKLKSYQDRNYPEEKMENEYFILASCYLCAEAVDKAKSLFDRSIEIFPKSEDHYFQTGAKKDINDAIYDDFGSNNIIIDYVTQKNTNNRYSPGILLSIKLKGLLNKDKVDEAYKIASEIQPDNYSFKPVEISYLIEKLIEHHQPDKAMEIANKSRISNSSFSEANLHTKIACAYASLGDFNTALNIILEQDKHNDRLPFDNIIQALIHYANSSKFNERNELKACEKVVAIILAHEHRNSLKSYKYKVDSLRIDNIPDVVSFILEFDEGKSSPYYRYNFKTMMEKKSKTNVDLSQLGAGVTVDEYLDGRYSTLISYEYNKSKFDGLLILAKQYSYHGNKQKAEEALENALEVGLDLVMNTKLDREKAFTQLSQAFAEAGFIERAKEIRSLYWIDAHEYAFFKMASVGHIANGDIQGAVDLLEKIENNYSRSDYILHLLEPLVEYGQYDETFEMYKHAMETQPKSRTEQVCYPAVRLAQENRIDLALKILGDCGLGMILTDSLNEIERLRIQAGYELTDDDLFNLRAIVHRNTYFCKYPYAGSKEDSK
jgi:tetratricopeptide (TPR) repeat protein